MAGGLDETWEGEVVETLENLFQMCKMREMTERKKKCSGSSSKQTVRRNLAQQLKIKVNKKRGKSPPPIESQGRYWREAAAAIPVDPR
jgi:hypothetical protein